MFGEISDILTDSFCLNYLYDQSWNTFAKIKSGHIPECYIKTCQINMFCQSTLPFQLVSSLSLHTPVMLGCSVNVTHALSPLTSFPKLVGLHSLPQYPFHTTLSPRSPQLAGLKPHGNCFLLFFPWF